MMPTSTPRVRARRRARWLGLALLLALLLGAFYVWGRRSGPAVVGARLAPGAAPAALAGFARAAPGTPVSLPADHGAHPAFQTEWWYFTGNLADDQANRWGYQFTIFRRALAPPGTPRPSGWAGDQVYLAHFAITDGAGNRHEAWERFSRQGPDLAGAQAAPFRVWLEDWQVVETAPEVFQLSAASDTYRLDLTLQPTKPAVWQGVGGYSQKGGDPGNASYYYSYTSLASAGVLTLEGKEIALRGQSWMDHEWSTSALEPGQVGWDWFSIQLEHGWELMAFQLRRSDGSADPFSSGALIDPTGRATRLTAADFGIATDGEWRSPQSGAVYPASWQITAPAHDLVLRLRPLVADQEMQLSTRYWEGAVIVSGTQAGQPVQGFGYVELTGYAESMEGRF